MTIVARWSINDFNKLLDGKTDVMFFADADEVVVLVDEASGYTVIVRDPVTGPVQPQDHLPPLDTIVEALQLARNELEDRTGPCRLPGWRSSRPSSSRGV